MIFQVTESQELDQITERLRAAIAGLRIMVGDARVSVTMSIGGAMLTAAPTDTAEELISVAVAGPYEATRGSLIGHVRRAA